MRRKLFLITLVLVFAFTMAIPMQSVAACNGDVKYSNVKTKVYYKVIKYDYNKKSNNNCGKKANDTNAVANIRITVQKSEMRYVTKLGYNVGVVSKFFDYNTLQVVKSSKS